jgi:hypothetical protein
VAHYLGLDWSGGGIHTEERGGVRWQLIWRWEGHWDHVHVGGHQVGVEIPPVRWPGTAR